MNAQHEQWYSLKTFFKPVRKNGFRELYCLHSWNKLKKNLQHPYMNRFYQSVSERFEKHILQNSFKIVFFNLFKTFQNICFKVCLFTFLKQIWKTLQKPYMNRFYQSLSERFEKRFFSKRFQNSLLKTFIKP